MEPADAENGALLNKTPIRPNGATVFQTSLNAAKLCVGTGTLALPFAAEKGGLALNVLGLGLIGLWNYYSANCLLRCVEYLPDIDAVDVKGVVRGSFSMTDLDLEGLSDYGTMDSNSRTNKEPTKHRFSVIGSMPFSQIGPRPPPPNGTTTYGSVAWYASGPKGLMVIDFLMILLFFGILIAYEVAMQGFINDTPLTTGSRRVDLLIPSAIVALLSCAPDIGFLSKFSGLGLLAVGLSFIVISWQGFEDNGFSGLRNTLELNLWPESVSAASSWFGVVVFGYGIVPFVFNIRDSMSNPQQVGLAFQIGLFLVYVAYIMMSNGIRVLFSPSHVFDGDVLQAMPNNWISLIVRLLMTFAVSVSAPLIVVPCAELIEGKLAIDKTQKSFHKRVVVRVGICIICTVFSMFLGSGFVHIVSFFGCFCVGLLGFVLPPLFCIQLSNQKKSLGIDSVLLCDAGILVLGVITTVITSSLTFRELMKA